MHSLLCRHGVRDFDHWKTPFDAARPDQTLSGMRVFRVFRDPADPHIAVFLFEAEDRARAEAFMRRSENADIGERAGVQPPLESHWLEKA